MFLLVLEMLRSKWKKLLISAAIIGLSVFLILYGLITFHRVIGRVYSVVKEMNDVDIWVMDPGVHSLETSKFIEGSRSGQGIFDRLRKVRSLGDVEMASPFSTGVVKISFGKSREVECLVLGLDGEGLMGGPKEMKKGKIVHLQKEHGIILDEAAMRLFSPARQIRIGEYSANIVGIAASLKGGMSYPLIYTTVERALEMTAHRSHELPFILVKAREGVNISHLCKKIEEATGLRAFTRKDFSYLVLSSYLKEHQLPYQFAWVVFFGSILTLGIVAVSLMNGLEQFQGEMRIFKAIGATRSTISLCMLGASLGIALVGWLIGISLYFGFYLAFSSFESIFPLSSEVLLSSFLVLAFLSVSVSFFKGLFMREVSEGVVW